MKFDVIIGLDFGHGEVAAVAARTERPDDFLPLSLTRDRDKVIPTVIHYGEDGTPAIGDSAANRQGMISYFKTAPGRWTLRNGDPVQLQGHSVREIMGDFYRVLMRNILTYNTDAGLKEGDRILLVVGSPASPDWQDPENRERYEQLIREATGIENVRVAPESRGAIFSAYSGRTLKGVNAKDGIAVFDFGSLTADFTYIRMGEMIMERSWDLGASQIEKAMLRMVLKLGGKTPRDVYRDQEGLLLHKLRREKEMYFSRTLMAERSSVDLVCMDELGDPVTEERNGKIRVKKQEIRYPAEQSDMDEFMAEAVEQETFDILRNGAPVGRYSWRDGCRAFLAAMKDLLDGRGLPYRMIVLTGGASRMPFVRELAAEVFRGTEVVAEDNPSVTVARGLCIIGDIDLRVQALIEQDRQGLYEYGKNAFGELAVNTAAYIAEHAVDRISAYLESVKQTVSLGDVMKGVEQEIRCLLEEPGTRDTVERGTERMLAGIVERVVQQANEAGGSLYRNQATLDIFSVRNEDMNRMLSADFFKKVLLTDLDQMIDPEAIAGMVFSKVAFGLVTAVAVGLIMVNPLIALGVFVAEEVAERVVAKFYIKNAKRVITPDRMLKIRARFGKSRKENIADMRNRIGESIIGEFGKSAELQAGVDGCVDDCMKRAYGIVAMQIFDRSDIQ